MKLSFVSDLLEDREKHTRNEIRQILRHKVESKVLPEEQSEVLVEVVGIQQNWPLLHIEAADSVCYGR